MKKLAISIIAAGIAALMLASCGGETTETSGTQGSSAAPVGTTTAKTSSVTPNPSAETTTESTPPPLPSEPIVVFGNLYYTLECDIAIVDGNAGIVFSGLNNSNFLMWQLSLGEHNDGLLYLRPHLWENGSALCFEEIALNEQAGLEELSTEYGTQYHMTLRVSDTGVIETLINGVSVYTTDMVYDLVLTDTLGLVGFRCEAYNNGNTLEIGEFDNLKITDATDAVLYEDDFSGEDSVLCTALLDGQHTVLNDGVLKVTGKYLGMADVEQD